MYREPAKLQVVPGGGELAPAEEVSAELAANLLQRILARGLRPLKRLRSLIRGDQATSAEKLHVRLERAQLVVRVGVLDPEARVPAVPDRVGLNR